MMGEWQFPLKPVAYLFLCVLVATAAWAADDEVLKIQKRFDEYLRTFFIERLVERDLDIIDDGRLMAMIYGCALGRQLNFVVADTEEYRLWLALEWQVFHDLEQFVWNRALGSTLTPEEEALKEELLTIAREAMLGKLDDKVEELIGVDPGESPSIFEHEEEGITVKTIAGYWKFMRGDYRLHFSSSLSSEITLFDRITDTGAACYELSPVNRRMNCWKLNGEAIEIYDVNGNLTYRFEKTNYYISLEVWHGVRYEFGRIAEEMNEPVDYYLTRKRTR
jgi:hypothetical protein